MHLDPEGCIINFQDGTIRADTLMKIRVSLAPFNETVRVIVN